MFENRRTKVRASALYRWLWFRTPGGPLGDIRCPARCTLPRKSFNGKKRDRMVVVRRRVISCECETERHVSHRYNIHTVGATNNLVEKLAYVSTC